MTDAQRLRRHLSAMQRAYARAEKALIKAALVGCLRRDPTYKDQREAGSSGRRVDLTWEVEQLRFARNELSMIEDHIRRSAKRTESARPRSARPSPRSGKARCRRRKSR